MFQLSTLNPNLSNLSFLNFKTFNPSLFKSLNSLATPTVIYKLLWCPKFLSLSLLKALFTIPQLFLNSDLITSDYAKSCPCTQPTHLTHKMVPNNCHLKRPLTWSFFIKCKIKTTKAMWTKIIDQWRKRQTGWGSFLVSG